MDKLKHFILPFRYNVKMWSSCLAPIQYVLMDIGCSQEANFTVETKSTCELKTATLMQ